LFLSTDGEHGHVPQDKLDSNLIARYAYDLASLEEDQAVDHAEFLYRLSLDLAPSLETAGGLARLLRQQERIGEAITVWESVAARFPGDDPDHWWAVAEAAELQRDWERAADAFGSGAQLAEEPYNFWLRQGRVFQWLHCWERAKEAYWRVFWLDPIRTSPHKYLLDIYLQQEQHTQVGRWIWMALQSKPNDVSWVVRLGDWRLTSGDRDGALEAYCQALIWQPGEDSIEERIEQATAVGDWISGCRD
jgi:tetratricopeptide (TPR) repeat protein